MRRIVAVTLALASLATPVVSSATSGGLDRRGGHHCWTRCRAQGYYEGQYHCHRSPCGQSDIRMHRQHGH